MSIKINEKQNEFFSERIYEILKYADYDCQKYDIKSNINRWALNKEGVYKVLSKHPEWDENNMYIKTIRTYTELANTGLAIHIINSLLANDVNRDFYNENPRLKNRSVARKLQNLIENFFTLLKRYKSDTLCKEFVEESKETFMEGFNLESANHYDFRVLARDSYHNRDTYLLKSQEECFEIFEHMSMLERIASISSYSTPYVALHYYIAKKKLNAGMKLGRFFRGLFEDLGINQGLTDLECYDYYNEIKGVKIYESDDPHRYTISYKYNYEQLFAVLSDLLRTKEVSEEFYISINPIDYYTQSYGEGGMNSCHHLKSAKAYDNGCYSGGIPTMFTDESSVICYTVASGYDKITYDNGMTNIPYIPKRKRVSAFFNENYTAVFQNLEYPSKSTNSSKALAKLFENILTYAYGKPAPNDSYETECNSLDNFDIRISDDYYLAYQDYNHQDITLTCLSSFWSLDYYTRTWYIGNQFTMPNGNESPTREDVENYNSDYSCMNFEIEEDGWYCDHCGEWHSGNDEIYDVYDRYGNLISVCSDCADEYYEYCTECGEYHLREDMYEYGDGYVCERCCQEYYSWCEHCGELVRNDDAYRVDKTQETYCPICYQIWKEENESEEDEEDELVAFEESFVLDED